MRLARLLIALLALLSLLGGTYTVHQPASVAAETLPIAPAGDVLVRFSDQAEVSPTVSRTIDEALRRAGISRVRGSLGSGSTFRFTVEAGRSPTEVAELLARDPAIRYAEADQLYELAGYHAHVLPVGASPQDRWALEQIGAPRAWPLAGTADITVAVLDTGVSPTHPDLVGRVLPGWNFVADTADANDDSGHGTYVAGIIAGGQSGGLGVGVAPHVKILPVKILNADRVGSTANFVAGIDYAVRSGARVINISAGGVLPSRALSDAIAAAEARGVLVVSSVGNDASDQPSYPAALSSVLAVGATDRTDAVAPFSSSGAYLDLNAPGVDIVSTWWSPENGDSFATASGTSAAAAFVSGAAALLLGANPSLAPAQTRQLLTEGALDVDSPGLDARSGFGRLDIYTSVLLDQPLAPSAGTSAVLSRSDVDGVEHLSFTARGLMANESAAVLLTSQSEHVVVRGVAADNDGVALVDLGPVARYPDGPLTALAIGGLSGAVAAGTLTVTSTGVHEAFKPIPAFESSSDRRYFPETGHSLSFGFKRYWETEGGLAVFGYPISEEFSELNADTGQVYTVQYFERNRFEYHPEHAGTPWEVTLGRLGVQIAPQVYPTASAANGTPGAVYFAETGHTLSGPFRVYWESQGGLQLFGFPTSEPFERGGRLVQYFERNRFELHPELPAEHQILLARFGVDLARQHGYLK